MGMGSLACPSCDAPTPLLERRASITTALGCPYCSHSGTVRDFLTLAEPHRAPRVNVFVRL
jgi:DNA-directed RNA polymerase subunit RPC12/RpoP